MGNLRPASTFVPARSAIVDANGMATWSFIKILQDWDTKLRNGLNAQGQFIGDIAPTTQIVGRTQIGTLLQYIDDGGQVLAPGIDFARAYLNKDTDHIADGQGSPLAGGAEAYLALVASNPVMGQTLRYDGIDWTTVAIAVTKNSVLSQWLKSYDAMSGTFTTAQPAFTDISGQVSSAQLPANAAKTDATNTFTQDQEVDGTNAFPLTLKSADVGASAVHFQNTSNSAGAWVGVVGSAGAGGAPAGALAVSIDGTATSPMYVTPGNVTVAGALHAQSIVLSSATTSTSATAGGATALPATPAGYLSISINGTTFKLPYYNP